MRNLHPIAVLLALGIAGASGLATAQHAIDAHVEHGLVPNGGVKIHYASLGDHGPLVVMLHGFPDYWYTWRDQMQELAKDHHVVAIDLRGYNKSDKPAGVAQYAMPILIADVAAVIQHFGHEKATVVGHDWGGAIAWNCAMYRPQMVDRLIICNLPHPRGIRRELRNNREPAANSAYARRFQEDGAHEKLNRETLVAWVKDPRCRNSYVEAMKRGDLEAMLHYYKANYPRVTAATQKRRTAPKMPKVRMPVLMIHGLEDKALMAAGLNGTWEWLEKDLTLVTVPGAGHFVQHDASELVTRSMKMWLHRDGAPAKISTARKSAINSECPFSNKAIRADCLTRYRGKVVGFCNPGCRDKFAKDPARYFDRVRTDG